MFKASDIIAEANKNEEDDFAAIIKIVNQDKPNHKNSRVKSFSPVSKTKDSFGLYYDQHYPDSAESRMKTKQMTYFSKKNLRDYQLNDNSRDNNLKYKVPVYNKNSIHMSSNSGSKGVLTTSNFSNNELKDSSKKKPQFLKWSSAQTKYKVKKPIDHSIKSTSVKYWMNYSTKRPKSAKGVGSYVTSTKYRQSENQNSGAYKQSMHKLSNSSKYTSSSKKKHGNTSQLRKTQPIKNITAKSKKDYLGTSYRKSNISTTHKKYSKTSRGVKKSNNSSSRNHDQTSMLGSNSSKISPTVYTPRPGLDPSSMNTKSYNSLMTMLMNKEQDMYKSTSGGASSSHIKSNSNTPGSNSKISSTSRIRQPEGDVTYKGQNSIGYK